MHRIEFTREADKQLRKIATSDRKLGQQIIDAIQTLATDPRPNGCVKLTNRDGYRIRIRDHRVLYTITDTTVTVTVFRIGARGSVY